MSIRYSSRATLTAVLFAITASLLLWGDRSPADEQGGKGQESATSKADADKWMKLKLLSSQQILNGLALADFQQIEESSRRMLVLNTLENWLRQNEFTRKSDYQKQLNNFEFAGKEILRNAQEKNIDGALEAYVSLTRSCVECHKVIRDDVKSAK